STTLRPSALRASAKHESCSRMTRLMRCERRPKPAPPNSYFETKQDKSSRWRQSAQSQAYGSRQNERAKKNPGMFRGSEWCCEYLVLLGQHGLRQRCTAAGSGDGVIGVNDARPA